jgi:uncharacterized protein YjbI with pentapeptide repeats
LKKSQPTVKRDWLAAANRDLEFAQVRFLAADLTEAAVERCSFRDCEFVGTRFNCANLLDSRFVDCRFT